MKVVLDLAWAQVGVEVEHLRLLSISYSATVKLSDLGKPVPVPPRAWQDPNHEGSLHLTDGEFLLCQVGCDLAHPNPNPSFACVT